MELFFASIYDAENSSINPYSTEIEVNGVPMAISIKEEGGIAIRPGEWADGMYEDWEKTDRTALLSDINRMACRPMGTIGAPTIGEVREYGDCLWNGEAIYDSYRFTWPEGAFEVAGQSYEYTKDELNNVSFDSGHEER